MASVPSTVNNCNSFDKDVYPEEPEDYEMPEYNDDDYSDGYYYPEDPIKNMMGTDDLTQQAQHVINSIEGTVIYAHEIYSWDDCDRYGPKNDLWSLYLFVEKNCIVSKLKFYREVNCIHDKDEEIFYEPEYNFYHEDNRIFGLIQEQLNSDEK